MKVKCDYCGKTFNKIPSKVNENNFCCRDHYTEWRKGKSNISPEGIEAIRKANTTHDDSILKNVGLSGIIKLKNKGLTQKEVYKYLNVSYEQLNKYLMKNNVTWRSIGR